MDDASDNNRPGQLVPAGMLIGWYGGKELSSWFDSCLESGFSNIRLIKSLLCNESVYLSRIKTGLKPTHKILTVSIHSAIIASMRSNLFTNGVR